ncbi:MAG: histidine kinase dimerization/phosphoacceptor domain -containing protein [Croceibacterium sp.]
MQQLPNIVEAQTLALAVIDAIVDPFVVLDDQVRLVAASRSFYDTFKIAAESAHGKSLYALAKGAWDIPELRKLFATSIPSHRQVDGFIVAVSFAELGVRTLCLNARVVASNGDAGMTTLVVMKDITDRLQIEADKEALLVETQDLLRQQRVLMQEMQHRVANSLQIIASILMLKARGVASEETREHLRDAQQRVISVAEVQSHLHSVDGIDQIDVHAYLTKLCSGLAKSMTGPIHPVAIEVSASEGTLSSSRSVSLGLIVTELVINAIKYAFPTPVIGARIDVSYEASQQVWRLKVADNGVGMNGAQSEAGGGLGTAIVAALAKQLGGTISTVSTDKGVTVTLAGVQEDADLPLAA